MPIHTGNLKKLCLIKYEFDIYVYNFEELIVLHCDLRISTAEAKYHQKLSENKTLLSQENDVIFHIFDQKVFKLLRLSLRV